MNDCAPEFAEFTPTNANTFVSTSQAHDGNKSLKFQSTGSTGQIDMAWSTNFCLEAVDGFAPVTFWLYMDALPTASDMLTVHLDDQAQTGAGPARFTIGETGQIQVTAQGSSTVTQTVPATMVATTWVDFTFSAPNCTTAIVNLASSVLDFSVNSDAAGSLSGVTFLSHLRFAQSAASEPPIYIDGMSWENDAPPAGWTKVFCADASLDDFTSDADPSDENFGYDYVEGVEFSDAVASIGLDDFYHFEGDSGDSDYLGKGLATGSRALSTIFQIEAGSESTASVFRVAYTKGATTLSAGAAQDGAGEADRLASSDGKDGGNFDDHVQVEFTEEGSDWRIKIRQNIGGTGLNTIGGASVLYGNPNVATAFNFTLDSRNPLTATLRTYPEGQIIVQANPGHATDSVWKDQWFIGTGADAFLPSDTALNNNDGGSSVPSTCVYDLIGEAVVTGSSGSTPNIDVPDDPTDPGAADGECVAIFCPPAAGIGGISSNSLSLFLGMVIVGSFAASMSTKTGSGAAGIAIFALLGLFVAYALGYIQLWVIVALTTMGAGAIFMGIRNGSKGAEF